MSQDEGALRHRDAGDLERGDEKDAYFWKTVLLKRMLVFERNYYYYYSLLSPGGKVGRFALPVSGARARLGGGRRVLLLAGSGGVCPRFRARGGLSCSL